MRFLLLTLIAVVFSSDATTTGPECQPPDYFGYSYWKSHYAIPLLPWGLHITVGYRSTYDVFDTTTTADGSKTETVYPLYSLQHVLQQTDLILGFRRINATLMFNFAHGDVIEVYQINPRTNELTITELGDQRFNVIIEKQTWFEVNFRRSINAKYAFLNNIRYPGIAWGEEEKAEKASMEKMISLFPMHEDFIRKFAYSY